MAVRRPGARSPGYGEMAISSQCFKIIIAKLVLSADQVSEGDDLTKLRISALFAATVIVIAAKSTSLDAQTTTRAASPPTSKSATIELSIAFRREQIPLGQKPWVSLTVKNLGSKEIAYPFSRVHVEGPKGEPPTTLLQRQLTNRLKPGEPGIAGGYRPPIAPAGWPGDSFSMKYDLSAYYDFKEPGKYTVYIEVLDETGTMAAPWVRSPVATFELVAPSR